MQYLLQTLEGIEFLPGMSISLPTTPVDVQILKALKVRMLFPPTICVAVAS